MEMCQTLREKHIIYIYIYYIYIYIIYILYYTYMYISFYLLKTPAWAAWGLILATQTEDFHEHGMTLDFNLKLLCSLVWVLALTYNIL